MDQLHNTYIFDNEYETLLEFDNPVPVPPSDPITEPQNETPSTYWRPSPKFQRLYDRFQNNILSQ
jgi:hypothetical protein